jgi:pimeloyl-ACP methyl ester carboxylesterase
MPIFPLTMRGLAGFGAAVLDELGVESAHVLGASFGGAVAQQMAFSHPSRVRRLVLVVDILRRFRQTRQPARLSGTSSTRVATIPNVWQKWPAPCSAVGCASSRRFVRAMHIRRPTDAVAALYRMAPLFGWTSLPWLWAIRQPALVIAGDDDPVTPLVNHRIIASHDAAGHAAHGPGRRAPRAAR